MEIQTRIASSPHRPQGLTHSLDGTLPVCWGVASPPVQRPLQQPYLGWQRSSAKTLSGMGTKGRDIGKRHGHVWSASLFWETYVAPRDCPTGRRSLAYETPSPSSVRPFGRPAFQQKKSDLLPAHTRCPMEVRLTTATWKELAVGMAEEPPSCESNTGESQETSGTSFAIGSWRV